MSTVERPPNAGVALSSRHRFESEEHIQCLAAAGVGIVIVPEHFPLSPDLVSRPLAGPPLRRDVVLATVGGRRWSPALDALIRLSRARDFAAEFGIA